MKDKKAKENKQVDYMDNIPTRVALLEMSIVTINATLIRLESKMEKGFDSVYSNLKWLVALVIGAFGGIFALMAHGFHWF